MADVPAADAAATLQYWTAATALCAPLPALAASPASTDVTVVDVSAADAAATLRYWTAARMATARDVTPTVVGAAKRGPAATTPDGPELVVPPMAGSLPAGKYEPAADKASAVPRPYTNLPDRLNAKVFFTQGGGSFVCSATIVASANKDVAMTAGHCVGERGVFSKNVMVVPEYNSSSSNPAPYGRWTTRRSVINSAWFHSPADNFKTDLGAFDLRTLGGQHVVSVVGGQGVLFNANGQQLYNAFGYPAAPPFNGLLQWRCNSPVVDVDDPGGSGPDAHGIDCNMTGGSSGGAWLVRLGPDGKGLLNGHNDYGRSSDPNTLYSPYYGNAAKAVWSSAQSG